MHTHRLKVICIDLFITLNVYISLMSTYQLRRGVDFEGPTFTGGGTLAPLAPAPLPAPALPSEQNEMIVNMEQRKECTVIS